MNRVLSDIGCRGGRHLATGARVGPIVAATNAWAGVKIKPAIRHMDRAGTDLPLA